MSDDPRDTRQWTIWQLARRGVREAPPGALAAAAGLLLLLLLGTNAVWGLTGERAETLVSSWMERAAPLGWWIGSIAIVLAGAGLRAWRRGSRPLAVLAAMVLANLIGVAVYRWTQNAVEIAATLPMRDFGDVVGVLAYRSIFLIPILPMLGVARLLDRRRGAYPLRFGDWTVNTRLFTRRHRPSWRATTAWFWLLFFVPAFLLMQAGVAFEPVLTGRLLSMLPAVLLLALINAVAEEVVFRGLLLPPLASSIGAAAAIWLQGAAFGLLHWGASPDPIAGLPMALVIGFFSVLGGKATLETGGLGFATLAHMGADVAMFSAHFI